MTYAAEDQYIINNENPGVALPSTGGGGTDTFTAAGLMLLLMAMLGWVRLMKKENQG